MPRLVGRKPNASLWLIPAVAIAVLAAASYLEYTGEINLTPKLGRSSLENRNYRQSN